jgi:ATP-dependent RNA helicase HelY
MTGGDFVRNVKQLIDLLRQVGDVAPRPETASTARSAADALFRGVVAASSTVGSGSPDLSGGHPRSPGASAR